MLFFLGLLASNEFYEYCSNPHYDRLGQNAWLVLAIMQARMYTAYRQNLYIHDERYIDGKCRVAVSRERGTVGDNHPRGQCYSFVLESLAMREEVTGSLMCIHKNFFWLHDHFWTLS